MLPTAGYVNLIYIFGGILALLIALRLIIVFVKKKNEDKEEKDI